MSDIGWRRLLYTGAALSILAMAIWLVFLIPQVNNQSGMTHGADWTLPASSYSLQ